MKVIDELCGKNWDIFNEFQKNYYDGLTATLFQAGSFCFFKAFCTWNNHFKSELSIIPNFPDNNVHSTNQEYLEWKKLVENTIDLKKGAEIIYDIIQRYENGEFDEEEERWIVEHEKDSR